MTKPTRHITGVNLIEAALVEASTNPLGAATQGRPNWHNLPDALREALLSLRLTLAAHNRRWDRQPGDAWLAGIIYGWSCPNWPHAPDFHPVGILCPGGNKLRELAQAHGWSADDVERLSRYSRAINEALGEVAPQSESDQPFAGRAEAAAYLARMAAQASPRYRGTEGAQFILEHPATVEHAYRAAQGNPQCAGPEGLALLTLARNMLMPEGGDDE